MKKIAWILAAALLAGTAAPAQTIAPFKDGDRVVYLGNSITDGGHYHSYIWLYYMTRFPEMNLRMYNAGIGGETAGGMFKRLDGDVFSKRPTVLTVTFGMNDTGYMEYNGDNPKAFGEACYKECFENYKKMEKRLEGLDGVRVVMIGSSPYDETARIEGNTPLRGKNAVMQRVVEFQKASADAHGWEFIDYNAPLVEVGRQQQAVDPSFTLTGGDRVHPDNDGHMVMAYLFLKAQGFAGKEVADIRIDAAKGEVLESANCKISNLCKYGRDLSFDYLANSLPYPMDTVAHGWGMKRGQANAAKLVPFVEEMNRRPHDRKLMRMGLMTALVIGIHNFPEGIATFMSAIDNPTLGIAIAAAIAIHNIPEGIAVSVPIYYATGSRRKAFLLSLSSGLAEPVGALLAYAVLLPFLSPTLLGCLFGFVAGIMVFISLDELLPAAEEYGEHHISIYGVVTGMALMAVSLIVFS